MICSGPITRTAFCRTGRKGGKAVSGSAPEDHPVWLTLANDNANNADTLITLDVSGGDWPDGFDLICLMFEGRDEASLNAARALWKTLQDKGADLTYWQQTAQGGWEKKQ
ncbi:MAG: DNA polymerase III subunit chi [Alphaproteobacteria bacterium]|nr:DNA polymerase III subunit chi [Alphaproteobacteria bacterium]